MTESGALTGAVMDPVIDSSKRSTQFVAFSCGTESFLVHRFMCEGGYSGSSDNTRSPNAEWIEGVINLRGTILSVIDLRKRLGFSSNMHEDALVIVVRVEERQIGFIVDGVDRVIRVSPEQISDPPEAIAARSGPHLIGFW